MQNDALMHREGSKGQIIWHYICTFVGIADTTASFKWGKKMFLLMKKDNSQIELFEKLNNYHKLLYHFQKRKQQLRIKFFHT